LAYNSLDKKKQEFISKLSAFRNPMDWDAIVIFNEFGGEEKLNKILIELVDRGMLLRYEKSNIFDLHPLMRKYCYGRLRQKEGIHAELAYHFAKIPAPVKVESVDDLGHVIELYHHIVRAEKYEKAVKLYRGRLNQLYYNFGAYQTIIELLSDLFLDGKDKMLRLEDEDTQELLKELAFAFSSSGKSKQAIKIKNIYTMSRKDCGDLKKYNEGLIFLANDQIKLGEMNSAKYNLTEVINFCGNGFEEMATTARIELGLLLAYSGKFEESERELNISQNYIDYFTNNLRGSTSFDSVVEAYKSIYHILLSNTEEALKSARKALDLAIGKKYERDTIRGEYLLGVAYIMNGYLFEAEELLNEALIRGRKANLIELESNILLEHAKLRFKQNRKLEALNIAQESLNIADRCEYRLKQADIHNFLTELYLDAGDLAKAIEHGKIAKERAECGYVPALERAERLLKIIDSKS
ncbi:MAG: hypothetical protein KAJ10_06585, partial [Thermodesulfovibrionia bacterium]|nr:hypothetical protein [Thermodesulfovibrionia bacterium]